MRVAIGGIPELADIVGREREKHAVLRALDGHGCRLTGDRRFGKTSLARLVEADCATRGDVVVRLSAERQSLADFVAALAAGLAKADSAVKRELDRWSVGFDVGVLSGDRAASARSLDSLVQAAASTVRDRKLVLLIDEIPVLAKAMNAQAPGSGAEVLHLLRRLRQDFSGRLAMVLSGSIGFHHVAQDALGAVNDIEPIQVGPLPASEAEYLAHSLLLGETVPTTDIGAVAAAVSVAAEGVPYYIHHLVNSALTRASLGDRIAPDVIPGLVQDALTNADDPWGLKHYRHRVPYYYGEDREDLVVAVLDIHADAAGSVGIDETARLLGAIDLESRPRRRELVDLVDLLEADHYLARVGTESQFVSNLVRRAWIAHRR